MAGAWGGFLGSQAWEGHVTMSKEQWRALWMYMPPLILKPNNADLHQLVRITMGAEDFCQQSTK